MIIHEMTTEECEDFLRRMTFGRLACARENQPYVVPTYFAFNGHHVYCFSTGGQKIEWMRSNPLVCLEVDEVDDHLHWKSVVALGRYEELCDVPACVSSRQYALDWLQRRAMWWQPAYVISEHRGANDPLTPIFYRIRIDEITGHQGLPDSVEKAEVKMVPTKRTRSFFSRLFRPGERFDRLSEEP